MVTKTYTAKRRAVAVLQTKGRSVSLGVDVNISNIDKVGPSVDWWESVVDKPGWKVNVNVSLLECFL